MKRTQRSRATGKFEQPKQQPSLRTTRRGLRSENQHDSPEHGISYREVDEDEDEDGDEEDLEDRPIHRRPRGRLTVNAPEETSGSDWTPSDEEAEADEPLGDLDDDEDEDENVPHASGHKSQDFKGESDDEMADPQHEDDSSEEPATGSKRKRQSQTERHPDAPKVSKLQMKVQAKKKAGLNVTSTGRKKGEIREHNGQLQYLHEGEWVKAVHHNNIREHLLKYTDGLGEYEVEPARGYDRWDRTAFHPDHASVRFEPREVRPDCLFIWSLPDELEDSMPAPGIWFHYGYIVLDLDDRPVRTFKELPLTLSGQIEGLRMEFYRRTNPRITGPDLRARMPDITKKGPKA
ncbi:MAG: hypothetical protein Q9218_008321, partial [Villophora microphyllina]